MMRNCDGTFLPLLRLYKRDQNNPATRKEVSTMKNLFSLILIAMIMFTAVGFAEPLAGSWMPSESPEITEELQALFDKGLDDLVGVGYMPVAYLGSQVVAGTNHCFLAQATLVYPGAEPTYVLIYLYENLQGEVEIMNIADFDFGAFCTYGA